MPVNPSQGAGKGSQKELELLNKANSSAPHPTPTRGQLFFLSDSSLKYSYGLIIRFRRQTEVFLNLAS